jgi:hypothetical protein
LSNTIRFSVVWYGGPHDGKDFRTYGAARRFAETCSLATLMACHGDEYQRATWYKANRAWYDGPYGEPLASPLKKHLSSV